MPWGSSVRPSVPRPAAPPGLRPPAGSRHLVMTVAGVALLLAGACRSQTVESSIDTPLPQGVRPCEEYYEAGKIIDHSRDGDFGLACEQAGELVTPVPATVTCRDGTDRRLVFNDYAWGFHGEEMTLFTSDDSLRIPPQDVVLECLHEEGETLVEEAQEQASGGG